ncbi:MAG: type II secretion system F family protein [Phycisphaerae bacterium]|nr:type II secretion system F family protein [Phycisphaerae bacterium]
MTQFAYTAVALQNASGGMVIGRAEATDERALRDELRKKGLIAVDVRPVHLIDALRATFSRERLRRADAVWFFQTLRMLLSGSVPIESAMTTMHDLAPGPRLKRVAADVRERLRAGASLADAVAASPGLATSQHLALLRAGHESGRLAHVVALIDTNMATGERIRRTLVGRLIYPAILLLAAIAAVWFLAAFVIPKFAGTLESLGGQLPFSTRFTLNFARATVWIAPPIIVALVALYFVRGSLLSANQKAALSRLILRTPVFGSLVWHAQSAIVTDTLATMIEGGGDVLAALGQAQEVVSSPAIAARLDAARKKVREGIDLGEAFSQERVLPPLIGAVLLVGIKGGDLVGGLRRCTTACLERQERATERLLVLMEPAVILLMAGAVGWVVYSLVMGMLAMNDLGGL